MIQILDTTLRDGEQTSGVSFSAHEKLSIAQALITELGVDRVEIASARVSEGEFDSVKRIAAWAQRAGHLQKLEVLGFVDAGLSIDWISSAGCKVINLLCKGSLNHLSNQLRKTPEQHIQDIQTNIALAVEAGLTVNIYLEDWSNGIQDSPEYVFQLMDALCDQQINRYMLPDTLGILNPTNTASFCALMLEKYPKCNFDFHAHNDYDLAVANVYAALQVGITCIHTTINGLGERAGNVPLSSVIAMVADQLGKETAINESRINHVSRLVETYSGVHISATKPIIGEHVFTQCAGIHADGDNKSNLYCSNLQPERFGRVREYALGKNSGRANIRKNLEMLGIDINEEETKKLTDCIIALGEKKEVLTQDDLPYIITDLFNQDNPTEQRIRILNYALSLAQGLKPMATVKLEIDGKAYEASASGDGQYDAFVTALRSIYKDLQRPFPILTNYTVSIPPGGRTDAFVQTIISWQFKDENFKTKGLDADQTEAAIKATIKMLNKIEQ